MLLDGKLVKNKLLENLENEFKNIKTTLVVIQVGDDFASSKYIKQKEKMANKWNKYITFNCNTYCDYYINKFNYTIF